MAISTTDIANPIHVDTVVPGSPSIITTEDRPGIFIVKISSGRTAGSDQSTYLPVSPKSIRRNSSTESFVGRSARHKQLAARQQRFAMRRNVQRQPFLTCDAPLV